MTKVPITLDDAVLGLRKKYKKDHFSYLDETLDIPRLSSGLVSIDRALGGGLPRGRIIEVFGTESGGKTALAMHFSARAQKEGLSVCYIDAEFGFDGSHAKSFGIETGHDKFVLVEPECGEESGDIIMDMLDVDGMGLIVIDSVASLTPRSEMEGDIGDRHVGHHARLMGQIMKMITPKVAQKKVSVLFINQIREKIGVMFGSPETTPGGRALKFYASMRLRVKKCGVIEDKDTKDTIGIRCEVYSFKNKTAPPFRKAQYDLLFNSGLSIEGDLYDTAVDLGIIKTRGAWVYLNENGEDKQIGNGRERTIATIREDATLFQKIKSLL